MTFKDFFTKDYLFNPTPTPESRLYIPFLIIFGLLVILGIVARIIPLRYDKMAKRYSATFLTTGICGLLYLFGRYETLPWLGARVVFVAIICLFALWMLINTVWALRSIPKHTELQKKQDRYLKYLPNDKFTNGRRT